MNVEKGGNRPVLQKRTQSADASDVEPPGTPNSSTKDDKDSTDDCPTLKKAPASSN
jgi:hypothetical protein